MILDNGVYGMWYDGHDSTVWRIGYATSEDGIHWTKYMGNPVLHEGPEGNWDSAYVWGSSVIKDSEIKGQLVRTLLMGNRSAGVYVQKDKADYWDGRDNKGEKAASGVYFYTLRAEDFSATRRMLIVK